MGLSNHLIGIINWAEQTLIWRRPGLNWSEQRVMLFEQYAPWSRAVAMKQFQLIKMPGSDPDDFIQYASIGLLEAIDRFEPKFGVPFKSFAYARVRGAIINNIFRFTEKSNLLAWQHNRRSARMREIAEANKQDNTTHPAELLINNIVDAAIGVLLEQDTSESDNLLKGELYQSHEILMMQNNLLSHVDNLPEKQKQVMTKHYQELMNFSEIASDLNMSVSRVSQLHKQALLTLKTSSLYYL